MKNYYKCIILAIAALIAMLSNPLAASAQELNNKVMNKPYADLRKWHLGFSIGMHTQTLGITPNGIPDEDGLQWWTEQPGFQPGFNVTGLFDLRLNTYFNLRFTPGLAFGSRDMEMKTDNSDEVLRQSVKTAYLMFPIDLKFSSVRYRNARPYLTAGVMPAVNLTRKRGEYLQLKPGEFFLTVGFGCDFYLPYFKFIPEVKFCFGLGDALNHNRPDLVDDPATLKITNSIKKATSSMVMFTFYFE